MPDEPMAYEKRFGALQRAVRLAIEAFYHDVCDVARADVWMDDGRMGAIMEICQGDCRERAIRVPATTWDHFKAGRPWLKRILGVQYVEFVIGRGAHLNPISDGTIEQWRRQYELPPDEKEGLRGKLHREAATKVVSVPNFVGIEDLSRAMGTDTDDAE